jgi:hypothetical protein
LVTSCADRMVGDFRGVRSIVILEGSRTINSSSSARRSTQRRYRLSLFTASLLTLPSRAAWNNRKSSAVRVPTARSPKCARSRRITLSAVSTLAGFAVIRSFVRYLSASWQSLGRLLGASPREAASEAARPRLRPAGLRTRRPFTRTSTHRTPPRRRSLSAAPRRTPQAIRPTRGDGKRLQLGHSGTRGRSVTT